MIFLTQIYIFYFKYFILEIVKDMYIKIGLLNTSKILQFLTEKKKILGDREIIIMADFVENLIL